MSVSESFDSPQNSGGGRDYDQKSLLSGVIAFRNYFLEGNEHKLTMPKNNYKALLI